MTSANPKTLPVALPPNPVWRSYAGGSVLRSFRGQHETADDHFPEDWLASTVCARNGQHAQGPDEGLSCVGERTDSQRLVDALKQDPEFWFAHGQADRTSTGVLWKLLDSSVRLQLQAHPDARFAGEHLGSDRGKTECWYILGTRPGACVYLGFQRPPSRTVWARLIREQRVDEMLQCFDRIPVQPGECFVVPAGTPHAIGAGVFMMELMEPTDWVVRCESVNSGITLLPEACFMGLDLERCLDIFDYRAYALETVRKQFQQRPRVVRSTDGCVEEELIGSAWHPYFRLHRIRGEGDGAWPGGELKLVVILKGCGRLVSADGECTAQGGQTWLLPGSAEAWNWRNDGRDWEVLLAGLPLPCSTKSHPAFAQSTELRE